MRELLAELEQLKMDEEGQEVTIKGRWRYFLKYDERASKGWQ